MKHQRPVSRARSVQSQVKDLVAQARRAAPRRAGGVLVPPRGGGV